MSPNLSSLQARHLHEEREIYVRVYRTGLYQALGMHFQESKWYFHTTSFGQAGQSLVASPRAPPPLNMVTQQAPAQLGIKSMSANSQDI